MKQRYDVIVVGAGPAGLLAAKAAAENGLEVALLERKKNIAVVQRSCGQSMVSMNEYYLGDLVHFNAKDGRICFPTTGFSFAYTGPCQALYSWQFFSPGMNMIQFGLPEPEALKKGQPLIGMVYDKENLLANLRDQMIRERVTVFEGTELTDIALQGNEVVVQAGGKEFHSTFVIAADGTNSRVVEKLGFNQERKHIGTLHAQSFFIRGFTPPGGNNTIAGFTFTEQGPAFMFLFPRPDGETWNVIFLALEKKVDLTKVGHHFMHGTRYAPWFKNVETLRTFSALEYIYSPILKPFKNNVLVIGDAASCQELEASGAMITGWKGGQAIAAAIKEREVGVTPEAITHYFDWWINTYIKNYDYEDYVKCFTIPYIFVTPEIMDYVFGLIKEPMPPCFNPYSAVRLLGQTMQGILPRIIADRPDILPHLMKMGSSASEILAHTLKD